MDNIVRFVSNSERERERLIREARAIYDSIFPPALVTDEHANACPEQPPPRAVLNPSSARRRSDTR